jgi:hypothetical protein
MMDSRDDDPSTFAEQDAFASAHEISQAQPLAVAPAIKDEFTTLRPGIEPLACWRLNEALFDFDCSFLTPGVRSSAPRFSQLLRAHPGALATIFGHADSSGSDEYNTVLSGRRAKALHALLVRDTAMWEELYRQPFGNDSWGIRAIQIMLGVLPAGSPPPYLEGGPSGAQDSRTTAAVKRFQADHGLVTDGVAGPNTRAELFAAYMDALCVDADGQPFSMTPDQFLGGGADPQGKGAYQGCSEFNPVIILSQSDQQRYDTGAAPRAERNARNKQNRRAMVFLFPPSVPVTAATWPCPRVGEGSAACRSMFWTDSDRRRSPGPELREYGVDRQTMACSWYDRFAQRSPCEGRSFTKITVARRDRAAELIQDAPYRIQAATRSRAGRSPDGIVSLTVPGSPDRCLVEWGRAGDPDLEGGSAPPVFRLELYVMYDVGSDQEQATKRLHNIGYPDTYAFDVALKAFQRDAELPETGALDDVTRQALNDAHGTLATPVQALDEAEHG